MATTPSLSPVRSLLTALLVLAVILCAGDAPAADAAAADAAAADTAAADAAAADTAVPDPAAPDAPVSDAPVPDELSTAVRNLSRVGSCSSPSFSPDGTKLAFVSDMSGSPQVWTVDSGGGWPRQVTAFDDQVSGVRWSPAAADLLALTVAPGGGLNQQVYLARPDGTGLELLTDGGRENNLMTGWSRDGSRVLLASNRLHPARLDVFAYRIDERRLELVAENPGIGLLADLDPALGLALVFRVESRSDANLFLIDEKADEVLLTPHEGPASLVGGRLADGGRSVYLGSDLERDRIAFGRLRLGEQGPGPFEVLIGRENADLESFELSPDGESAALVWNVAGRSELELVQLAAEGGALVRRAVDLPAELARDLTFSADGRRLAMTLGGSTRPSDLWVLDLQAAEGSRALQQVSFSPHAGVDLGELVEPELLSYPAHDQLELSGWLYRPPSAAGPSPFVLSFHGGPEGQARPRFRAVFQALLRRGIGVFVPNVRGSSGFGKRFVNLDNGALRFDGIRDIEASVAALVATGTADAGRLGIMGGSYGGYMTMAGLAFYPDLFGAGANLFGVVNFETFFAHTEPWMAAISTLEYGDPKTQAELLRELSPIHKLDRVKAPTLVLHGANDTNVPVVEAEQVVETLEKRGIPVEYVLFPDEGHGFRKTANRLAADIAIVRWFETHLTR